ncbi:MAG: threonine synthase [Promethearchaeota archaeon]|nr:MAG: threonine synthase [Candidatus Lokiarchaeota archaeon]
MWFELDLEKIKQKFSQIKINNKFWDYKFAFPEIEEDFIISLGEGGTPCRSSKQFGEKLGIKNLYFKDETQNPTNSFKDRTAALLISHARSWEFDKIICASNGNQGASIAAYCSLEGIECLNIIPKEIDIGKKAQMIAYNSEIKIVGETVDDAIDYILNQNDFENYYQCTSELNPLTLEAQKIIAYEIINQTEKPKWVIIPMGSGELLVSLWKGFNELKEINIINDVPKLIGVQSQSSSPIVNEFLKESEHKIKPTQNVKPIALGILVKKPLFKDLAIKCIKESEGTVIAIPEKLILSSIEELVRSEGIFAEPASALTLSAVQLLDQKQMFEPKDKIVCLITGSGLKAPYVLEAISSQTKTTGKGSIIITKLKILSQISISSIQGISGTKIKETMGSISLAAIYQHLKELETKGLISRKKEGKNVLYFITDSGNKVLDALDVLITLL